MLSFSRLAAEAGPRRREEKKEGKRREKKKFEGCILQRCKPTAHALWLHTQCAALDRFAHELFSLGREQWPFKDGFCTLYCYYYRRHYWPCCQLSASHPATNFCCSGPGPMRHQNSCRRPGAYDELPRGPAMNSPWNADWLSTASQVLLARRPTPFPGFSPP